MASSVSRRKVQQLSNSVLRRLRLRRAIVEALEPRMLMASDLLLQQPQSSLIASAPISGIDFQMTLQRANSDFDVAADARAFLDNVVGTAAGDMTAQPWFPLVNSAYDQWVQDNGLAFTYTASAAEGESGLTAEGEAGGPRLLSVAPNSGDIFSFNGLNTLNVAPSELVFRFDGSSDIDPTNLSKGIRITRSGRDGVFGNGNDTIVTPGYVGFGDTSRVVVVRFASTLPDDTYRIEVMGTDVSAQQLAAVRNTAGLKLQTRLAATDRDTVNFKLDLGAQVSAVVPQPVDRASTSTVNLAATGAAFSLTALQGDLADAAVGKSTTLVFNTGATTTAAYDNLTNTVTVTLAPAATVNDVATAVNGSLAGNFTVSGVTNGAAVFSTSDLGSRTVSFPTTTLDPKLDTIRVYFNNDDLYATKVKTGQLPINPTVVNPSFYQLVLTGDTVTPNDDMVFNPSSISYDPATDIATLKFPTAIHLLGGSGSYRLRIGGNDVVTSSATQQNIVPTTPGTDPGADVTSANTLIGTVAAGTTTSLRINGTITGSAGLNLDYPGGNQDIGHREIPVDEESHVQLNPEGDAVDSVAGITTRFYNFGERSDGTKISYGTNALSQPVYTSITPEQKQRVREIFEFYSTYLGLDFVETEDSGLTVIVGDLFPVGGLSAPGGALGLGGGSLAVMDGAENWDNNLGQAAAGKTSFFETAMHEIGHMLNFQHDSDLPIGTIMRGTGPGTPADAVYPGDNDVLHGQYMYRPDSRDIDLYKFAVPAGVTGTASIEVYAERLANSSNLDSHLTLFRQTSTGALEVIAANDDYLSSDSLIKLNLSEGTYFIGLTAAGNQDYNSASSGVAGSGGVSEGSYQIAFNFIPDGQATITDTTGSKLDGDGDGVAGGNFNFWFRAAPPVGQDIPGLPKTIYVDKGYTGVQNGSASQPFSNLPAAIAATTAGDILRVVGSLGADNDISTLADNPAYEIGRGGVGNVVLSDGLSLEVPNGVTLMVDAGAILKVGNSRIVAGSRDAGIDNRFSSLQVLGTPARSVFFTSYTDESMGTDTNPLPTSPKAGDWGGIELHNDIDRNEGRGDYERKGIFLNYISNADIRYGGGRVTVSTPSPTVAPIDLSQVRATILNNKIRFSADSAISADPNSFEETRFTEPRYQRGALYQPDYTRVGPDIRGNTVTGNSINGLFVRSSDSSGQAVSLDALGRFDDTDITYVLGDNLTITGTPGGSFQESLAPAMDLVTTSVPLVGGVTNAISYIVSYIDSNGEQGRLSAATAAVNAAVRTVTPNNVTNDFTSAAHGFVNGMAVNISSTLALPTGLLAGKTYYVINATANTFQLSLTVGGPVADFVSDGLGVVSVTQSVQLGGLPKANRDFVGRMLWKSVNGGTYFLVAELDKDTTTYTDSGARLEGTLASSASVTVNRARIDARLQIDPGVVIKSLKTRIEVGIGAQLIAEGLSQDKIIFTSRFDDRFGAGGTFDTNNDGTSTNPSTGDWGGIMARQLSSLSIDAALVTYAGGITTIPGGFAGVNAVEIQQANARIANSTFENNASGMGADPNETRVGRGNHDASVIYVRGAQPTIINNKIQNNPITGTAAISVDANAMKAVTLQDGGRQTGDVDRMSGALANYGPLVRGNHLLGNAQNGLRVRGAVLTTESVWDDTDIVHVLSSNITVGNFHSGGGLMLKSRADESLVVKVPSGPGFFATGTPMEISDRIGGEIQVIGAPGFPVVLTSLKDDSVGAGFDPQGRPSVDTDNNGTNTVGAADAWGGLNFDQLSNDRNLDTVAELETDEIQDTGTNDTPDAAQPLGALSSTMATGDENKRLGFTIHGAVASIKDLDVYSFLGTPGSEVWVDIDKTDPSLDVVLEVIDSTGRIIAQSDNSLAESIAKSPAYVNTALIGSNEVQIMEADQASIQDPVRNSWQAGVAKDFQSVNPNDAGLRFRLPGTTGQATQNTYYLRVRSSNIGPGQSAARLQDTSLLRAGLSEGSYRMQVRMQQTDEVAGSTVRYADIRYAGTGITAIGLPAHSPLLGTSSVAGNTNASQINNPNGPTINPNPSQTLNLGNIAASDRGSLSVAGNLGTKNDADFYQFSIGRTLTQKSAATDVAVTFDIDYASDFGGPNTNIWVYKRNNGGALQLVLTGSDSNIADDRATPGTGANLNDLSRGSFGALDAYIGTQELPPGDYVVAVTNNARISSQYDQFQNANAANTTVRVEPVDSVRRLVVDRFGSTTTGTATGPVQVAFDNTTANLVTNNQVPWTLGDISMFVATTNEVQIGNAFTGAKEATMAWPGTQGSAGTSVFSNTASLALSPNGRMVAWLLPNGTLSDGNEGQLFLLDDASQATTTPGALGAPAITTWTTIPPPTPNPNNLPATIAQANSGFLFTALGYFTGAGDGRLFGAGSRGDTSFGTNNGANPLGYTGTSSYTDNIIYRMDDSNGNIINPVGLTNRTGTSVTQGAGTVQREFGRFISNNFGTVTGIATIGTTMYAVSDTGELFIESNFDGQSYIGNVGVSRTIRDASGFPIQFAGLTAGPRNLENGRFANMLFGIDANGTIYAFNPNTGLVQNVFTGGASSVRSATNPVADVGSTISGIAFSPLDVNLWHVTNTDSGAAGHGRQSPIDQATTADSNGDNSLYFGWEAGSQTGTWTGAFSGGTYTTKYNTPGGAHGAIESRVLDLSGYSSQDLPTLYFNYKLNTAEQTDSPNNDGDRQMQDAFRVYAVGDNGTWILLATNNTSDNGNYAANDNHNEMDPGITGNADPFNNKLPTQPLFDQTGWRQARVNLAAFAGNKNVRLRFEFSSAGSFATNDPLRGGVELNVVAGPSLNDSVAGVPAPVAFTVRNAETAVSTTFELDLGLVLNIPSGGSIAAGDTININGTTITFTNGANGATQVPFLATETGETIATRLLGKLNGLGFTASQHATLSRNTISVRGSTAVAGGTFSVTGLPSTVITGVPGVATGGAVAIPVNIAMTSTQVRDAIRTSLAATLNVVGQGANTNVWPVYGNTIRMFGYGVTAVSKPLSVSTRSGDAFGDDVLNGGTSYTSMSRQMRTNGTNVGNTTTVAGVFVDDIVIGAAERGEMVFGAVNNEASDATTLFVDHAASQYNMPGVLDASGNFPVQDTEVGRYQLEIRTSAEYLNDGGAGGVADLTKSRASYDTNDRLSQSIGFTVSAGSKIADGTTFTLSDGVDQLTYEFDVLQSAGDTRAAGVTPGNVKVQIFASDSAAQVAAKVRDAINSTASKNVLKLTAGVQGEMKSTGGSLPDTRDSNSATVILIGSASTSRTGDVTFSAGSGFTKKVWGAETRWGEDLGDQNRLRDQGVFLISSSSVSRSVSNGILIDASARTNLGSTSSVPQTSSPGSPINFPTQNTSGLAPGVVVINTLLVNNGGAGILISGDAFAPTLVLSGTGTTSVDIDRPTIIARVLNNTFSGNGSSAVTITDGAAPIILNNIIASSPVGINANGADNDTVIGANLYFSVPTQIAGTISESYGQTAATSPFVDSANGNFYLVGGSKAIDSSLEKLLEAALLTQLKATLGLPDSPAFAPDRDGLGQRRVDDPTVSDTSGVGTNVFKDRGAIERSDVFGLQAVMLNPQDNDSSNVDVDRNSTTIRVLDGIYNDFSILLTDGEGTGANAATVIPEAVNVTENGRRLQAGVDYVFGYNANSRTIQLTPLAGMWRKDSVYEITLNNKTGLRLLVNGGATVRNGDSIIVTPTGSTPKTYTFRSTVAGPNDIQWSASDSAYVLAQRVLAKLNALGGTVSAYMQGDGSLMITGAAVSVSSSFVGSVSTISGITDMATNPLVANRANGLTQFTIVMPEVPLDYGDSTNVNNSLQANNGARHAILPIDIPLLALGSFVDGDADGNVSPAALGDDNETVINLQSFGTAGATQALSGPATLTIPAGNTVGLDGQTIVITDPTLTTTKFEFDSDSTLTDASAVSVAFLTTDTASQVAAKFAAAVNTALLAGKVKGVLPVANGAVVTLGGLASHKFDVSAAPAVVRQLVGDVSIVMPSTVTGLDGATFSIADGNGSAVTFEINDTSGVVTPVTAGNLGIDIALNTATPASLATAIAAAVNGQTALRALRLGATTAVGSTVRVLGNDDDGVTFGSLFNSNANPVPVTVTSTASGMLDAWIDWNGDGNYSTTEQIVFSQPVVAGANAYNIQTPAGAKVGFTTARFRLSTFGATTPTGLAIGGEVEDYLIEIVAGTPPVAVPDTYTTLEDPLDPTDPSAPLVVAAPGVLGNDTDAENDALTVYDPNPATPTVEPVVAPTNGTLTLNRDGSFSYMPNLDFYGTDTFVYYVTDPRLISNAPTTVTITVNPVNDAPKAFDDSTTILEDAVTNIAGSTLWGNDWKHLRNDANESAQTLSLLSARILGPADGVTQGSIAGTVSVNTTTDTLTYTPPADYNNAINGAVLIEVTIIDNGAAGASTNRKTAKSTLTVNLTPINDRPLFTMPASTPTVEDAGAVSVSAFVTNPQPGPVTALDEGPGPALVPENQTLTYQVRALDASLFSVLPQISPTGTLTYTLAPDVNRIQPGPGQPGFPQILVEVIAKDSGSNTGTNLNLSLPQTFTIVPTEVNDKPEITVPTSASSIEDQGLVTINGFATGIRRGPITAIDEGNQTLTATFGYDPAAFTTPPSIDLVTGNLTYQTAPNVNNATGQSLVVVMTLTDGGPFAVPAQSIQKTFTLSVTPVNDAPVFTIPSTTATTEDAGAVTVANFATNIAPGPTGAVDEGPSGENQQVSFQVRALNTGLFVTQPQISPTGTLTYQLAADVNRINPAFPQILVEVIAVDTGSSATPNVNKSAPVTFTILPTEINDAPLFTIPSTFNATEDQGLVTVNNFMTGLAAGPSTALDEVGQTFSILVTGDTSAYITQPAINLTTGALTFQTAQDVNSFTGQNLVVTVTITDSGSNVSPNVNSTTKQFTLNIAPVNDVPVFSLPSSTTTVFEDNEQVTGVSPTQIANFGTGIAAARSTALDENGNPVAATKQSVNFTTVSVTNSSLFTTQPTISPTGTLQFATAPNQNGSSVVVVRLIDSGSSTVPNVNTSADQTFTIVVKPVNDPPEYFMPNANPTGREDQGLVTLPGFLSSLRPGPLSATDENGQTFTITVTANDPSAFSVLPSIAADGTLTYQTAVDVNSVSRDLTITFYLQDNGTAGPLPDNNRTPTATFSITTAAVNDAPQFALPNPNVTVIEDVEQFQGTLLTNIAGFATGPSGAANTVPIPGPATATDESSQSVNFSVVAVSAPELFEVQPSISSTGMLSFKTAANQNGKAIVVVRLVDGGPSSPSPNTNQSAQQTFTITITPVNDAPQFDIPSGLTINEDQGLVTRSGFATNVRRGPGGADDENSQEIRFQVTPVDPTAFETQPSFLPDGTLSFKTAPNVNSLNKDLTVLVTLVDNGTSTPAPNQNTSVTRTFSITTNAVNDPPIADQFSIAGTEDQPLTILASNVLLGDVGGPTADELGQSLNITQVERTTSKGGTVTPVFGPDGIVSMTYTPPANLVGSDSFLYVVTDNGTPSRSGTGTISISMLGVNDPPQFVKGADQTVLEDASAQTVSGWATGILAGPPSATDELSQQTVSFVVVSDHPEYFEIQPSVAADGTLSFKPAKDANGIAVVSVVAKDNGLNVVPNVNVSPAQNFSITITPVNDAPVFTAGASVTVQEDSPAYSQTWATNVAPAAGLLTLPPSATDEAGQVVDFIVTADKPNLFSVQPAISSTGVLTFTPSRDAFGIAFVTVTAKDRGPAGTLDRNTSSTQTMTITINAVNDKPVAIADSLVTNENTVLTYSAPGLLSNDTDADLPADAISAVAVTTTSSLGARVVINADGSVTYDPTTVESIQKLTTGQSVIDTFTYKVKDLSGTESDPATVNVVVTGIDDPPIAADDTVTIPVGQNKLLDVLANDSDVDTPIDPRSIVLTAQPTFGTAVVNSTGVISYTPGVGFRGVDTLRYTVADQAGHVSNEAIVTVIVNNAPVAANDSAYTFKNQAVTIDVLANDSDADGTIDPSTVQITEIPAPSGTAVVQPNGKILFTPSTNYSGQVQFSYIVRDDAGTASNVAKVNVQVFQSIWRNPTLQLDVSADGFVSPIDALLVINYINAGRPSDLPGSGIVPAPYYDTNGDEKVTPIDALLVINYLNTGVSGEGEGEGSTTSTMFAPVIATMVTPEQMLATVGNGVVRDLQAELESVLNSAPEAACAPWSDAVTVAPISDRAIASLAEGEGEAADLTDLIAGRNRGLRRGDLDDFFGSF